MGKQLKKATSVFSIKKATIKNNEKKFTDKILNNDIGKEYIIIIAPQKFNHDFGGYLKAGLDAGPNSKFMFVHQAIRRVRKNQEFNFNWTILMYSDGYTTNQINSSKKAFLNFAKDCNFIEISGYQEAVNYINSKDKKQESDIKKMREKTPIERMFIYSHGFLGLLAMGLSNANAWKKGSGTLDWDKKVVDKLKQKSFSKTAKIYSFSCKTGLGNKRIEELNNIEEKLVYYDNPSPGVTLSPIPALPTSKPHYTTIKLPLLGEKSLAQEFANITGATVYAYCSRSEYSDTLNTADELDFMQYYREGKYGINIEEQGGFLNKTMYKTGVKDKRHNKKYEYLLNKNKITKDDDRRYNELNEVQKRRGNPIDNGIFDPEGARYPVRGGDTPVGVPNDMKTYTKK